MAGDKFDDAIIKYMRKVHKLYIGERTMKRSKDHRHGISPRREHDHGVQRQRPVTGLPKNCEVSSEEIMEALEEPLHTICEAAHSVWSRLTPELAADIKQFGIVITGGELTVRN